MRDEPKVGVPYIIGAETIIPTYVQRSEAARPNGSCLTEPYAKGKPFNPTGWFVQAHYEDGSCHGSRFIPFLEEEEGS